MNKDLLNNPENPCESNTFGMRATLSSNRKGFTLAETLIVLVVLGVIATLTVPNLINKQKETTQRTKIKKAMAAYEQAVNKMLLEHDRSFDNLNTAGCNTKTSYFKYIKRDTANTCIFQAPDKLWWDLTYIERPVISFNEITAQNRGTILTNANNANDKTAFVMVGRYDDQGILRVDDLNYETLHSLKDANNYESKAQLEKLYGFVNNKKDEKSNLSITNCEKIDDDELDVHYYSCTITGSSEFSEITAECDNQNDIKSCNSFYVDQNNENGIYVASCSDIDMTQCSYKWINTCKYDEETGDLLSACTEYTLDVDYCSDSEATASCTYYEKSEYAANGNVTKYEYCDVDSVCSVEFMNENGKSLASGSDCDDVNNIGSCKSNDVSYLLGDLRPARGQQCSSMDIGSCSVCFDWDRPGACDALGFTKCEQCSQGYCFNCKKD